MTGLSISDLTPVPGFSLAQVWGKGRTCETEVEARAEDGRHRAPLLRESAARATNPANRNAAEELVDLLDYGDADPPETPASKLYMREVRDLLVSNLSSFILEPTLAVASVHLEPRRQELAGACLDELDPKADSHILRAALYAKGLSDLGGAAILFQDDGKQRATARPAWNSGLPSSKSIDRAGCPSE